MQYTVELGERSYPILIGDHCLERIAEVIVGLKTSRVLIVTNTTVGPLYAEKVETSIRQADAGISVSTVVLPDGEQFKDLDHIEEILAAAVKAGLDRRSVMIALGGGVVGDMTGFAASMWMRGIRFVQVPTTLLAQVDSSVGGKTGVNLKAGKNLIGAFHQPKAVLIDPLVLKTLPKREISAGIAEIIKYGFLGDADFVLYLHQHMQELLQLNSQVVTYVVGHCCKMKAEIVRADEKEGGVRAKLNLGHTYGHAIEKLTGYGTWLHGEAVAVGLIMAAVLSKNLGYLTHKDVEIVKELVAQSELPQTVGPLDAERAYEAMQGDKKADNGIIRFVVMKAIGQTAVETVSAEKLRQTMREFGWK